MVDGEARQLGTGGHAAARVMRVDRRQIIWGMLDVERLIEDDHPARAIWELVGRLDLVGFIATIGWLKGGAGRPAYDPHLLISLWVYAYSRGIGSAREVARRCEHDPAFRWLTGLMVVNHHTLSDFRLAHRAALDELFTQVLGLLSAQGLIELQTITHDSGLVHGPRGCQHEPDWIRRPFSRDQFDRLTHAAQVQCRPPSPDPEDPLQGDELARLRGRATAA